MSCFLLSEKGSLTVLEKVKLQKILECGFEEEAQGNKPYFLHVMKRSAEMKWTDGAMVPRDHGVGLWTKQARCDPKENFLFMHKYVFLFCLPLQIENLLCGYVNLSFELIM